MTFEEWYKLEGSKFLSSKTAMQCAWDAAIQSQNTTPKYKQGVTLEDIVADGWSRGFSVVQIVDEVRAQGFDITIPRAIEMMDELDVNYKKWCEDDN